MLRSVHVVFPIAGTIAVYSCERDGFALLRNIQARYVGWAVLETALRQVAYHYIVKCLSEQGQGHSPPSSLPLSPSPLSSSPPLPPPFLSAVQMVAALPTAHGALSVSAAVGLDNCQCCLCTH